MELKKTLPLMIAIFFGVLAYNSYLHRYHPEWWTPVQQTGTSIEPITGTGLNTGSGSSSTTAPTTGMASGGVPSMSPASQSTAAYRIDPPAAPSAPIMLGSLKRDDPQYALALNISSNGAALDSVYINSQKAPDRKETYIFQKPFSDQPGLPALGTQSITINGVKLALNVPWNLESSSVNSATYGLDIKGSDNKAAAHISRTWHIEPPGDPQAGYNVTCDFHVRNFTDQPLKVQIDFLGPTMPPREIERSDDRQIVSGYDAGNAQVAVTFDTPSGFKPGADVKNISLNDKGQRLLWVGESSQYFSAIIEPAQDPQHAGQIQSVQSQALNHTDDSDAREIGLSLQTAELTIAPQTPLDVPLKIFLGPKDRTFMEGDYYGSFPLQFNKLIGSSGFCSFPILSDFLVKLLGVFHWVFRDWGMAIIVLVIIVRTLLHPITKSSQVSMMGVQKMGPEMDRLKKKYGDDKDGLAKAQMGMWKEMGISPLLGCLPMFLQTPIWIALYSALQSEIKLRQAPFLWGFTWIHDLSRPDRLIEWDSHAFKVPMIGIIASLNILPILLGVVFVINQQMQPQPPTMTPEQAQQKKMMKWMSLLFPVFLYLAPSGLNLYILTSTTIGIFESKIIRKHIKEREEAEKKVTIIDGPTGKVSKTTLEKPKAPPGKMAGLWANLQERLAEAQREAEKRNKKK